MHGIRLPVGNTLRVKLLVSLTIRNLQAIDNRDKFKDEAPAF
jgi:hypothetical protein